LGLRSSVLIIIVGLALLSGCNTTKLMNVPNVSTQASLPVDKPTRDQATFALSKVIANIKRGTVIGHYPASSIKGVNGTLCNHTHQGESIITWGTGTSVLGNWSTELGEVFHQVLSSAGLNIAGDPADLFGQEDSAQSAEYAIGARITEVSSNICQEHDLWHALPKNAFSGEMYMAVDWTVFSNLTHRETLSLKTEGYDLVVQPSIEGRVLMLHNAFAKATEALLSSPDFIAIAKREYKGDTTEKFAGDEMAIPSIVEAKDNIADKLDGVLASIATVRVGRGHGSGFFISQDGLLLTNAHVVGESQNVSILLNNGLEVPGKVLRKSVVRDVALIKVNLRVPQALSIRDQKVQKLERIYVVGTPIDESLSSTVTSGVISGLRNSPDGALIQADASISPGNSGGPLLDDKGNVLGLSVQKIIARGSEGLSLFVPIHDALDALKIRLVKPSA